MPGDTNDNLEQAEQGQATVVVTPVNGSVHEGQESEHDCSDGAHTDVENDVKSNLHANGTTTEDGDDEGGSGRQGAMGKIVGTLQVSKLFWQCYGICFQPPFFFYFITLKSALSSFVRDIYIKVYRPTFGSKLVLSDNL